MQSKPLAIILLAASLAAGAGVGKPSKPAGYLTAATAPDTLKILPPAPLRGGPQDTADRAIFLSTRALANGPRWAMAAGDSDKSQSATLADFSCAVGVRLDPDRAAKLSMLLTRMRQDVSAAVDSPKDFYQRRRPFQVMHGAICKERDPGKLDSPDYPSGHAAWGWSVGLVLAELAPDRSTPILVRARAYGESRVVCGVHNLSAVTEARTDASAVVAALHGDAGFRADLESARAELAALRSARGPSPADCGAEAALAAKTPW